MLQIEGPFSGSGLYFYFFLSFTQLYSTVVRVSVSAERGRNVCVFQTQSKLPCSSVAGFENLPAHFGAQHEVVDVKMKTKTNITPLV